jgi:polysaccharide chain length determinant protein (PEP-CTERM system associated)
VASLRVRADEYQRRAEILKEMMDTVPQVEAELTRLNRDYGIHKAQYEALLERLEQARLSEEAGQSADNVKFKVIDPPRLPLTPIGPNRPLFMSIVLLAGIGAGIGIAFVLSFLRPVFDSRRSLREVTGLPVLGSVGMVWTAGQIWRRRMGLVAFVFAASGLAVAFSGVMVVELLGLNFFSDLSGFGTTL